MRLSDIQNKDVISLLTGENIGNIIDIKVDEKNGNIISLILQRKKIGKLFLSGEEIEVSWNQISKIGEDVILVETK